MEPIAAPPKTEDRIDLGLRIPAFVLAVALFAALLHIAPFWRAQSQVPHGWTFRGVLNASPDYMQYSVWARRTLKTGILVDNSFTSEPTKPYLPVLFFYVVGKISRLIHVPPEFVFAYAGSVIAFLFVLLLFTTVRNFFTTKYQVQWVFLVALFGGGLGAYLEFASGLDIVRHNFILRRVISEAIWSQPMLEDIRGVYLFTTLFDTHSLFIWTFLLASILSLYLTLRRFSLLRVAATAMLFAFTTFIHVYEGVTLLIIVLFITLLFSSKKLMDRSTLITLTSCTLATLACFALLSYLYNSSGLPFPSWRNSNVLFSTLLIGYPLAWVLIAWGISGYWRKAALEECFLLGWALGCTALALSGPFYPWPDRGTWTLQIPLYIVVGSIYFSRYKRVNWRGAAVVLLLAGVTGPWVLKSQWRNSSFDPNKPAYFISADHREIVDFLRPRAQPDDLLMVDKSKPDWMTDDLWLAPEYPGKLYCGHFFLTVNYKQKRDMVIRFFENENPEEQADFLRQERIRFLYVDAERNPQRFEHIPGLVLLKTTPIGTLFEFKESGIKSPLPPPEQDEK
jgi:hypothetical protein